jgi:hypothetical protein
MSDLPSEAGERKFAPHNVIAVYPDVAQAREALTHLERKGIEAGNIELLGPGMEGADAPQTNDEQRGADMAVVTQVEKRSGTGFLLGAVIGIALFAAVMAVAHYAFDVGDTYTEVLPMALVAGGILGGFAGFFYGGATGLPVSDAWGETFEAVRGGQTLVAVHSEQRDQVETAIEALRGTGATKVATFGPDGRTTEV